jgi:hypothetical protein
MPVHKSEGNPFLDLHKMFLMVVATPLFSALFFNHLNELSISSFVLIFMNARAAIAKISSTKNNTLFQSLIFVDLCELTIRPICCFPYLHF